ncbi:MAG: Hpt domain-containing protein [Parvibaculaceae bacterium]
MNQNLKSYLKRIYLRKQAKATGKQVKKRALSMRQPVGTEAGQSSEVDPAIFDREHLSQYTAGDPALERELVALFLGHFAPIRTQLDAAASAQDWKFAAHSLKGSARSIGAPHVAALAETLEVMGFAASGTSKTEALDALDAAMAAFADEAKKVID